MKGAIRMCSLLYSNWEPSVLEHIARFSFKMNCAKRVNSSALPLSPQIVKYTQQTV